jgi:hypothetical protein
MDVLLYSTVDRSWVVNAQTFTGYGKTHHVATFGQVTLTHPDSIIASVGALDQEILKDW